MVRKDQQGKKLGLRIIEALDHIAEKVGCYKVKILFYNNLPHVYTVLTIANSFFWGGEDIMCVCVLMSEIFETSRPFWIAPRPMKGFMSSAGISG